MHVAAFRVGAAAGLRAPAPATPAALDGIVPAWQVSDAFPEADVPEPSLDPALLAARTWGVQARFPEPRGLSLG